MPGELRVTRTANDSVVIALHRGDRCASGPLAIPADALDTLRSALADLAGETGHGEATDAERPATCERRSDRGTP